MKNHHLTGALALAAAVTLPGAASASGFAISDKSVSALGNAFAGAAARADDASALYNNPATLTQLGRTTASLAVHRIQGGAEFSDSESSTLGDSQEAMTTTAYVPNVYYVTDRFGPNIRVGVGVYSPFGLRVEYDEAWKGRYHSIASELRTVNISPTLAVRATPQLSMGASLDLQYAEARLEQAVDFGAICVAQTMAGGADQATALAVCSGVGLAPQQADGGHLLTGDNWSYGISLGLAYEFGPRTRIGAVWHGPIRHETTSESDFSNVPQTMSATFTDSGAKVALALPETASFSLAHGLSEQLTLLADYTWTGWSRFDELRVRFTNDLPESVTPQEWNDSSRYSLGLNYRLNTAWLLRAGIAFDESPVPSAALRSPRVPDGDGVWYTAGFNWAASDGVSFDLAYAYIPAREVPIDNTDPYGHRLDGSFDVAGEFLSAQLNWQF